MRLAFNESSSGGNTDSIISSSTGLAAVSYPHKILGLDIGSGAIESTHRLFDSVTHEARRNALEEEKCSVDCFSESQVSIGEVGRDGSQTSDVGGVEIGRILQGITGYFFFRFRFNFNSMILKPGVFF